MSYLTAVLFASLEFLTYLCTPIKVTCHLRVCVLTVGSQSQASVFLWVRLVVSYLNYIG